jgi:hypothetical protein
VFEIPAFAGMTNEERMHWANSADFLPPAAAAGAEKTLILKHFRRPKTARFTGRT